MPVHRLERSDSSYARNDAGLGSGDQAVTEFFEVHLRNTARPPYLCVVHVCCVEQHTHLLPRTTPHSTITPHHITPQLTTSHYTITLHLTTPHYTSSHFTTPHYTAPHLTSPHLTSPHLTYTTPHHTSSHHTSPHLTTPHHTSLHLTSPHLTTPHLTTPHHTTPHHTSSHHTPLSLCLTFQAVVADDLATVRSILDAKTGITSLCHPLCVCAQCTELLVRFVS